MNVLALPPMNLVQGQVTGVNLTFLDDAEGAMDLTGWTGEIRMAYSIGETPFFTADLALAAEGAVVGEIPADTTANIPARPEIGGTVGGIFQIILTAPDPEFNQVWQGPFVIAGAI